MPIRNSVNNIRIFRIQRLFFLILPALLSISLYLIAMYGFFLPNVERSILKRKNFEIQSLTDTAWSILASYDAQVKEKVLSRTEAEAHAITRLRMLRYGLDGKNYFWINDMKPYMIMHPYRTDLIGEDLSNYKDKNGKYVFLEMVRVVKEKGAGWVRYFGPYKEKVEKSGLKMSYVRGFQPWGWIVGTGVYLEDIKKEVGGLSSISALIGLGIFSIMALLSTYIVYRELNIQKERRETYHRLEISETRYRSFFDESPTVMWEIDLGQIITTIPAPQQCGDPESSEVFQGDPVDLRTKVQTMEIIEANEAALIWSGTRDKEEFKRKGVSFTKETWPALQYCLVEVCKGKKQGEVITKFKTLNGEVRDVVLRFSNLLGPKGQAGRWLVSVTDITKQKQIEADLIKTGKELQETANQLEAAVGRAQQMALKAEFSTLELNLILSATVDGLCVIDNEFKILRVNKPFARMIGKKREEILGKNCNEILSKEFCQSSYPAMAKVRKTKKVVEYELQIEVTPGKTVAWLVTANPYLGPDGEMIGLVTAYKDISRRKKLEAELKKLATIDSLTKIYNRRYFMELAEKEIDRSHRYKKPLSLIMIDIDYFKKVNDTFGHSVGDQVLNAFSTTIANKLRINDIFGRLGGEEFGVLLVETDLQTAVDVAQRFLVMISDLTLNIDQAQITFTVSAGVAQLQKGEELNILLNRADQALYTAKNRGRNRVEA